MYFDEIDRVVFRSKFSHVFDATGTYIYLHGLWLGDAQIFEIGRHLQMRGIE